MTYRELSDAFDVYSNRYAEAKFATLLFFDEYEKSLFLTKAANEIVKEMLPFYDKNEKIKKQLLTITRAVQISTQASVSNDTRLKKDSIVYELPEDVMYVVAQALRTSTGALLMRIKPLQDDEAYYTFDNPFRSSTRGYAWSVGISDSTKKYTEVITSILAATSPEYYLKYVCDVPAFVVTDDLLEASINGISTNANLDDEAPLNILHEKILDRAVSIGYMAKGDDINSKVAASNLSINS
jgi:hypothetical protein